MSKKPPNYRLYDEKIIMLRELGRTRQEIADELGLTKLQIKNWIFRYNKRQAEIAAEKGIVQLGGESLTA